MTQDSNHSSDRETNTEDSNGRGIGSGRSRRSILRGLGASAGLSAVGLSGIGSVAASSDEDSQTGSGTTTKDQCKDGNCPTVIASSEEVDVLKYSHEKTTYVYWVNKKSGKVWLKTQPAGTAEVTTFDSMELEGRAPGTFANTAIVERSAVYHKSDIGGCWSVYSHHEAVGVSFETNDALPSYTEAAIGGIICSLIPVGGVLFAGACAVIADELFGNLDLSTASTLTFWAWDIDTGSLDLPEVAYSGVASYGASLDAAQDQGRFGSIDGAHISSV